MPTSDSNLAMSLRSLYAPIRENPHEKKAKIVGSMIPQSGLASPALGYVMGREMSNAEDWDTQRETEGKAAQEQGVLAYKDRTQQEEAGKILDFVAKVIDKDPNMANQILKAKVGTNKFLEPFKDMNFGPTIDGWTLDTNKTTGRVAGINLEMFKWQMGKLKQEGKMNDQKALEEVIPTFWKVISPAAEKDNLPYKVGQRHAFTENGATYEGTFQGLDPKTNEPIWGNKQFVKEPKVAQAPEDKQGKVGIINQVNDEVAADWMKYAVENAKLDNREDIRKEFSDPLTGKIQWQKVRDNLTPEQQDYFDHHKIKAQKYGRTEDPATAARMGREDMLKYRQGKAGKPAAAVSPDANATAGGQDIPINPATGKQYQDGEIYLDPKTRKPYIDPTTGKQQRVRIK